MKKHEYTAVGGNLPAPFIQINIMKAYAEFRMGPHVHPFYHVNQIMEGSVTVMVDEKTHIMDAGCIFVLPPHIPHTLYSEQGYLQIGADIACQPDPTGLCAEIEALTRKNFAHVKHPLTPQSAAEKSAQMQYLLRTPSTRHRLRAVNLIERQILDLLDQLSRAQGQSFLDRFTEMTLHTDAWNLKLSDMCHILSMSRTQLERQSHMTFGCGASEYCARLRYARICELLMSDEPLEWIAAQTGFYDACHLSKFFTARAGISPGNYRKILQ